MLLVDLIPYHMYDSPEKDTKYMQISSDNQRTQLIATATATLLNH